MHTMSEMSRTDKLQSIQGIAAIRLDRVSVLYRRESDRPTSVKELFVRLVKDQMDGQYVRALDDISLDVLKGEVFGVVGRNGAGKSTLLKTISRIIRPTQGRVQVWGRVSALLALGAGFHKELTGRENVYLYSSLLGRSELETKELFDSIVEFAEIQDFIDSPIRMYSTGMIARLGFATAMAQQPDILLVDEVLGVGDEMFREKCRTRFREFQERGATVVIVSHRLDEIQRLCQRALWLHEGKGMRYGGAKEVAEQYRRFQKQGIRFTSIRQQSNDTRRKG